MQLCTKDVKDNGVMTLYNINVIKRCKFIRNFIAQVNGLPYMYDKKLFFKFIIHKLVN